MSMSGSSSLPNDARLGLGAAPPALSGDAREEADAADAEEEGEEEAKDESKALRLARKAESARQARLRHKGLVQRLQQDVQSLKDRGAGLERAQAAWSQQLSDDLRAALPPERWAIVQGWLRHGDQVAVPLTPQTELSAPAGLPSEDSPEMLLCALSMDSPSLRATAVFKSSPLVGPGRAPVPLSAIPAIRLQNHQQAVRNRRSRTTNTVRQRDAPAASTMAASDDGLVDGPAAVSGTPVAAAAFHGGSTPMAATTGAGSVPQAALKALDLLNARPSTSLDVLLPSKASPAAGGPSPTSVLAAESLAAGEALFGLSATPNAHQTTTPH